MIHVNHGHGHHHTGPPAARANAGKRALIWALALNTAFLVVEAAVGFYTGSLALLSDAVHMVGDVGSLAMALGAAHLAAQYATSQRSFGFARAEVLAAFLNSLVLVGAVVFIVAEAVERIRVGTPEVTPLPVFIVGGVGLAINLGSGYALFRADGENLNIRGALFHMMADALGSLGAVIAALFMMAGWQIADPIASLVIGALVLFSAIVLLKASAEVLLQFAPNTIDVSEVRRSLSQIEKVVDIHDLHCWSLDGQEVILTAHIVIEGQEGDAIREAAATLLEREYSIAHATLQIETVE